MNSVIDFGLYYARVYSFMTNKTPKFASRFRVIYMKTDIDIVNDYGIYHFSYEDAVLFIKFVMIHYAPFHISEIGCIMYTGENKYIIYIHNKYIKYIIESQDYTKFLRKIIIQSYIFMEVEYRMQRFKEIYTMFDTHLEQFLKIKNYSMREYYTVENVSDFIIYQKYICYSKFDIKIDKCNICLDENTDCITCIHTKLHTMCCKNCLFQLERNVCPICRNNFS